VFDVEPGAASSNAVPLGRIGNKVVFTARNDTTALWQVYAATIPQPYAPRNLAVARPADTGVRAADRITLVNRPPITGQAPADSLVRLFIDDVEVGTGIARKGVFEITPGTPLADGNHAVRATATDDLGRVSALSQVIGIRIDTNAPRVRFNPPTQQAVEMRFTEKVGIAKSDLRLKNLSTNQMISSSAFDLDYSTTTNVARLTFSGMPAGLAPGHYELKLEPGITDLAGNALAPGTTFAFSPKLGPAVGASKTILRINGTGADDRITLRRKAGVANLLEVLVNGALSTRSLGSIESIRIESFAGDDVIRFDSSNGEIKIASAIYAGAGHDAVFAGDGRDRIYGGAGDDQIHGAGGNDILYGEAGRDRIFGGRGSDHVVGGLHADLIQGDDGTDRLVFQQGVDRLSRDRLDTLVRDTV
jgi:hypothetical protein